MRVRRILPSTLETHLKRRTFAAGRLCTDDNEAATVEKRRELLRRAETFRDGFGTMMDGERSASSLGLFEWIDPLSTILTDPRDVDAR